MEVLIDLPWYLVHKANIEDIIHKRQRLLLFSMKPDPRALVVGLSDSVEEH
jgi:hypothetical protein